VPEPASSDVSDTSALTHAERLRLDSLRYASNTEVADYVAIMRVFTSGTSGLMSDHSAGEVVERLAGEHGVTLDESTVEDRLSYLTTQGNLARSPRETRARSIEEYLRTRARFQLTSTGELAHRLVEELLGATDSVREVSTEMLAAILAGLRELETLDAAAIAAADPNDLAGRIATLFNQHRSLVESTREFYAYLGQILDRYDLSREDFRVFKTVLIDYLTRFVDDISKHMPQIGEVLDQLANRTRALVDRANEGPRLVDVHGRSARRAAGLDIADWAGLRSWFLGGTNRRSDAEQVRSLATSAMRTLVVNLRRMVGDADREVSQQADLLRLAAQFATADDDTAHALWAAVFGLYPARHLGFPSSVAEPIPATASWWRAPVADVPVSLVERGERAIRGRASRGEDFSAAKRRRIAHRRAQEAEHAAALAELRTHLGPLHGARLSTAARTALLDLHARTLAEHIAAAAPGTWRSSVAQHRDPESALTMVIRPSPGHHTTVDSPDGGLTFHDLTLELTA
jgi:uncharacterized protein (TIGR02677 family)